MTTMQLQQQMFQTLSELDTDENLLREALAMLREFVHTHKPSAKETEPAFSPKRKKVKEMTQEEKQIFLAKKRAEYDSKYPEIDRIFDDMKLSADELNDEKSRYILGL